MARVAVNRHRLPGVEIEAGLLRHYPDGELFAHAVGSVRRLSEADLQRVDPIAYSASRFIGRLGVEAHTSARCMVQWGMNGSKRTPAGASPASWIERSPGPGTI